MLNIRPIEKKEVSILYDLIYEMASFEKLTNELTLTKEKLNKYLFENKVVSVDLLREEDKIIGYLMYYYTFSSFTGTPSLYLEDIYVRNEYRHLGYGTYCFKYLAKKALAFGAERMDFVCLDWNKNAQNFYKKMGAKGHSEWLLERLDLNSLTKLAEEK